MSKRTSGLRLMTFNVRHATDPSPHSWEERLPLIRELLQRENPDLIGTQECYYSQIKDMLSILPDYDYIGLGRNGGSRGEYSAIFYRRDRFDVLEYDHYWLSDTPGLIGSTTWNHEAPQIRGIQRRNAASIRSAALTILRIHLDMVRPGGSIGL